MVEITDNKDNFNIKENLSSGNIEVSENVFRSIINHYVLTIPEVVAFSSGGIVSGISELIGKSNNEHALQIKINEEFIQVDISIILEFGCNIPEASKKIQKIIITKIQELTGKEVGLVNIKVSDIQEKKTELSTETK